MLEAIRALYAYSAWANGRILATAGQLAPEQVTADVAGLGSIRDTLVHTAAAQLRWLERWQGSTPGAPWDPARFAGMASLRTRWMEVEDATAAYVSVLREPDLMRVVSYVNQGETRAHPLWQQLLHQANHATQHRSEAALLLTRLGKSPGDMVLRRYFDEQDSSRQRRTGS